MRAPITAASSESEATAAHVIVDGQISKATSCAMPEQISRFIAKFSMPDMPWRAAAAPTTRPNTMMPGATGWPLRKPTQTPGQDQDGFSDAESIALMAATLTVKTKAGQRPGLHHAYSELSALRLRRDVAGRRRVGARPRLAGRRHGRGARTRRLEHALAPRRLAGKQGLELVARERLELQQALGQHFESGAARGQDARRLGETGFDQTPHFGVDLAARLLRDVLLARHLIAEEALVLVLAIGHRPARVGRAPARRHHARELGPLLGVGCGAGRRLVA